MNFNNVVTDFTAGAIGTAGVIGTDKLIGMIDKDGKVPATGRAIIPAFIPTVISMIAPKSVKGKEMQQGLQAMTHISVFRVANSMLPDDFRVAGPFNGTIAAYPNYPAALPVANSGSNVQNQNVMV